MLFLGKLRRFVLTSRSFVIILSLTLVACHCIESNGFDRQEQQVASTSKRQQDSSHDTKPMTLLDDIAHYQWTLIRADQQEQSATDFDQVIAQAQAKFELNGGKLTATAGCNRYSADVAMKHGHLYTSHNASTLMACYDSQTKAESTLFNAFHGSRFYLTKSSDGMLATLTQVNEDLTLTWQGQATLESLYGKAKTMFWEIDPNAKECIDGSVHCLKVRSIDYDDMGIEVRKGAWRNFKGEIVGYTHDPSLRQIIRIKVYHTPNHANDYIYVYDTAVSLEATNANF
ncbi:META and DUF4377 domain-containing protein [Moraxella nasovis]|uniref:META domain-containing protein n=1 Tax=Moraxella nasovis TaxID=2904121 RepID=UPI001F60E5A7|nr:META domain-containing protein [Moraxella nasovis]UNU73585.1 META and DUF4377 domain-containing protein [Moraxella nasovis]